MVLNSRVRVAIYRVLVVFYGLIGMAKVEAAYSFDMDLFNLHAMRYGALDVLFLNNQKVPGYGSYDIWFAAFDEDAAMFGGSTLRYDTKSKLPTSGTATLFASADYTGDVYWGVSGLSVSGGTLAKAMKSISQKDDFAILKSEFAKADTFTLSDYDDRARGYGGNDKMYGNWGDDSLYGGSGNDIIKGHDGADYLTGGEGGDTLYGGMDDFYTDTFVYNEIADSKVSGSNRDFIYNFEQDIDNIKLTEIDANTRSSGNQKFFFSDSGAAKNSVWCVDSGADVLVYGDVNGDAKADFAIKVMGLDGLSAGDFLL